MRVIEQALKWITAVGVPILILLNAVLIPFGFGMARDIGEIRGDIRLLTELQARAEQRMDRTDAENGARFTGLEERMRELLAESEERLGTRLGSRIDAVEAQVVGVEERLGSRIDAVEAQVVGVEERLGVRIDGVDARLGSLEEWIGGIDLRVDRVGTRLDGLSDRLETTNVELTRVAAQTRNIEESVAAMNATLTRRGEQIEEIARGLERTERDPAIALSRIGVPVDADIATFWIGGRIVSLPRTDEAREALREEGFDEVRVSPSITGYVAPTTGTTVPAEPP